jgi:hypothetical protein
VGRPLQDGIGTLQQTIGGVLFLDVALMPAGGSPRAGVLEVDCMLPGIEFPIEEGVNFTVGSFNFEKVPGSFTLFHVLQGVNQAN